MPRGSHFRCRPCRPLAPSPGTPSPSCSPTTGHSRGHSRGHRGRLSAGRERERGLSPSYPIPIDPTAPTTATRAGRAAAEWRGAVERRGPTRRHRQLLQPAQPPPPPGGPGGDAGHGEGLVRLDHEPAGSWRVLEGSRRAGADRPARTSIVPPVCSTAGATRSPWPAPPRGRPLCWLFLQGAPSRGAARGGRYGGAGTLAGARPGASRALRSRYRPSP